MGGKGKPHLIATGLGQLDRKDEAFHLRHEARSMGVVAISGLDESRRRGRGNPLALGAGVMIIDDDARQGSCREVFARRGILRQIEHLSIRHEPLAQGRIGQILHRDPPLHRQHRRGPGGLTEDHEDRLHPDRTEGDVRARNADRHEQIRRLPLLRHDRTIRDDIGTTRRDLHVAFVLHFALRGDVALHVVRIHVVASQPHRILRYPDTTTIQLGHDVVGNHAPRLAHIDLAGPVSVSDKFIGGQAPGFHRLADHFGNARVVCEGPHEALLVNDLLSHDAFALRVRSLGVVVVHSDLVRREGSVVVRVGLVIRHHSRTPRQAQVTGLEIAEKQLVWRLVVAFGLGKGHPVPRILAHAHSEIEGLDARVARTVLARAFRRDVRDQSARRIARNDVGIDRLREEMPFHLRLLHAVERFAIDGIRLAPDMIRDPGGGEEVALVGGVEEHRALESLARLHRDRGETPVLHRHPFGPVEPLFEKELCPAFGRHRIHD